MVKSTLIISAKSDVGSDYPGIHLYQIKYPGHYSHIVLLRLDFNISQ